MAESKQPVPDLSDIQPDRLIKYRVSEDKMSAEVLLPGLSYTDFDKKIGGKWTLWSLSKLVESVRWVVFISGFQYYPELVHGKNRAIFVATNTMNLSLDAHYIQESHWGMHFPLRFALSTPYIGNSSYTVKVDMFNHQKGTKLASALTTVVYIDKETRKPTKLPDFFRENAPNTVSENGVRSKKPDIPATAFQYQVKVLHSDCDANQHANASSYIRWCCDAGTVAALGGQYKQFTNNVELYPVDHVSNVHIGDEVLAGKVITVSTWEDADIPRLLHFVVTNNKKPVYIATFKFYEGKPVLMPVNFKTSKL